MNQNSKLRVDGLSKVFAGRRNSVVALQDINIDAREGEFISIIGPSGCGKTTLLRICGGLESPSVGTVEIANGNGERPSNNMVFQEQSVFPWLTVLGNIEYGLLARGVPKAERRRIAEDYIARLHLSGFGNAYPHQLSGGMKQRVSIGRAFANDPEILLMDEPFANLDEQTKLLLQEELLGIWQGTNKTVLFITHSLEEAVALGDRVIVMTSRPGRIKTELAIDLPRPRSVLDLKGDRRFLRLVGQLWNIMRDEVTQAADGEVKDAPTGRST